MKKTAEMTLDEARRFIASVPWRAVRMDQVGDTGQTPDPHEYVIREWSRVDAWAFHAFVDLVKAKGYKGSYRAPYRPDHVMRNVYLELDGWCYWRIGASMLNREQAENRKHVPDPEHGARRGRPSSSRLGDLSGCADIPDDPTIIDKQGPLGWSVPQSSSCRGRYGPGLRYLLRSEE